MKSIKSHILNGLLIGVAIVGFALAANTVFTDLEATGDLTVGDDVTITDDVTVGGDLSVTGNTTFTGTLGVSDNLTLDDLLILSPSTFLGMTTSSAVTASRTYHLFTSTAGAVKLASTPTISTAAATNGQLLIMRSTSTVNYITIQDNDTLSGSQLELGADTRDLDSNNPIVLIYDSGTEKWHEVAY